MPTQIKFCPICGKKEVSEKFDTNKKTSTMCVCNHCKTIFNIEVLTFKKG